MNLHWSLRNGQGRPRTGGGGGRGRASVDRSTDFSTARVEGLLAGTGNEFSDIAPSRRLPCAAHLAQRPMMFSAS